MIGEERKGEEGKGKRGRRALLRFFCRFYRKIFSFLWVVGADIGSGKGAMGSVEV